MKNYQELLTKILSEGSVREDRTGVGTISLFGEQLKYDLNAGFPAITTKRLAWRAVVSELLWFLEGSSDERRLAEILHGTRDNSKKTIWTANANADYWKPKARYEGDLGRVYGVQWRFWRKVKNSWQTVDQVRSLIDGLKNDPQGRRHILTAWNPGDLDQMALPPCHMFAQFYVSNDNKLTCLMHQRSCDMFLGVPFNIASYSLLTHILARECNLGVGEFIWSGGDCHIYANHVDAVRQQLIRTTRALPVLSIREGRSLGNYEVDDFNLIGYDPHDSIKAEMAV